MSVESMDDVMRMDDRIDELTDDQTRKALIVDALWRTARDELQARYGPQAFNCRAYDDLRDALTGGFDGIGTYLDDQDLFAGEAVNELIRYESDAVDDVYTMFYGDTAPEEARDAIKGTLAGCFGMPRDKILRDNIRRWTDG